MALDSIDELTAWAMANGRDFGWWKTARTVDDRIVLALPPHDSIYTVEVFRDDDLWVVRHGDSSDSSSFTVRHFLAQDDPGMLLEVVCRSLIADATSILNSNPGWASALGECVLAQAEALGLTYLKIASEETIARASSARESAPEFSLAVEPTGDVPIPKPYSPPAQISPQAPLRNQYFNEPTKAKRRSKAASSTSANPPRSSKGSGLAIASLILGISGYLLLFTWFSVVIALSAIGTGLAVLAQGRPGKVLAWVGLGLGCLCMFVAVALLLGASRPGSP